MKKIVFATLGLALFATPLAAGTPHAGGGDSERYAAAAQTRVAAPAGNQSYGLAGPGTRSHFVQPNRRHGVPYSTPPQGWPLQR